MKVVTDLLLVKSDLLAPNVLNQDGLPGWPHQSDQPSKPGFQLMAINDQLWPVKNHLKPLRLNIWSVQYVCKDVLKILFYSQTYSDPVSLNDLDFINLF